MMQISDSLFVAWTTVHYVQWC